MTDSLYYQQLQAGAEYLAGISADRSERSTHLKMAGIYCLRAREAGGANDDALSIERRD